MTQNFLICALPRSRTAWLSQFLSYRDWHCGHDQLRYMRTLDDIKNWFSLEKTGTCETGASPFWRLIAQYAPDLRVVTIRRPVEEVVESLIKAGVNSDPASLRKAMHGLNRKLDQLEGRLPNVKSVPYSALSDEIACAEIFEFCLPYGHDSERWKSLAASNIQVNFPALMRYVAANLPAINKLGSQARQAMFRDLAAKPVSSQNVIISEERCQDWLSDCHDLFKQHCLEVGEQPENWMNKNLTLMQRLYDAGYLQVMVARSNGRPFGYLMTIISPSLEVQGAQTSQHTTFYASPDMPGLGLKLQRAAMASLKEKGISEVYMRAGVRGEGERVGALFRRLGAQHMGQMYRLELES